MVEFILLNEEEKEKVKIQESIDKVLMNYDIDYKVIKGGKLEKIMNSDSFKIYILEGIKGVELAKKIRLDLDDWNSYILFIGNNFEQIIKERLFILDYIEKEIENKRCLIKTKDNTFYIPISLKKLEEKLDNRFIKCSKSYIINIEQVEYYDIKENIIVLKNKEILTSISKKEKKNILEKLRTH